MTIEEAIRLYLYDYQPLRALVAARIYPNQAPADAGFPRIVYEEADRQTVMTMSGPVLTNQYTMDLLCQAEDYTTAKAVARHARKRLLGHQSEASGIRIMGIFGATESDEHELPTHAEERGIFGVRVSLSIWFRQPDE